MASSAGSSLMTLKSRVAGACALPIPTPIAIAIAAPARNFMRYLVQTAPSLLRRSTHDSARRPDRQRTERSFTAETDFFCVESWIIVSGRRLSMKDAKAYPIEMETEKIKFLNDVVAKYGLADPGKAVRCLINYARENPDKHREMFEEIRCSDC